LVRIGAGAGGLLGGALLAGLAWLAGLLAADEPAAESVALGGVEVPAGAGLLVALLPAARTLGLAEPW
jgi:hypothetical protein